MSDPPKEAPAKASQPTLRLGVEEQDRHKAAELFYRAFAAKLSPVFGKEDRAIARMTPFLNLENALALYEEERLLGLAGLTYAGHVFFKPSFQLFRKEFGLWSACLRYPLLAFLEGVKHPDALYLECLAVDSSARGRGLGTILLQAVEDFCRTKEMPGVYLDVVDTNPRARALYERIGYSVTKTQTLPLPSFVFGFKSAHCMHKEI